MNPCPLISQRELAIFFQDRGALMNSAATTGSDIVLLGKYLGSHSYKLSLDEHHVL